MTRPLPSLFAILAATALIASSSAAPAQDDERLERWDVNADRAIEENGFRAGLTGLCPVREPVLQPGAHPLTRGQ